MPKKLNSKSISKKRRIYHSKQSHKSSLFVFNYIRKWPIHFINDPLHWLSTNSIINKYSFFKIVQRSNLITIIRKIIRKLCFILIRFYFGKSNDQSWKITMECSQITLTRVWFIDGAVILHKTVNFIYQNYPTVNFVFCSI